MEDTSSSEESVGSGVNVGLATPKRHHSHTTSSSKATKKLKRETQGWVPMPLTGYFVGEEVASGTAHNSVTVKKEAYTDKKEKNKTKQVKMEQGAEGKTAVETFHQVQLKGKKVKTENIGKTDASTGMDGNILFRENKETIETSPETKILDCGKNHIEDSPAIIQSSECVFNASNVVPGKSDKKIHAEKRTDSKAVKKAL